MITKCGGEQYLLPNNMMVNTAFIKLGLVNNVFGAYYGIMIDSMFFNGAKSDINKTTFWKTVGRIGVVAEVLGPISLPYFLIGAEHNMIVIYLFRTTLPLFLVNLFCFSLLKLVYRWLRLL